MKQISFPNFKTAGKQHLVRKDMKNLYSAYTSNIRRSVRVASLHSSCVAKDKHRKL